MRVTTGSVRHSIRNQKLAPVAKKLNNGSNGFCRQVQFFTKDRTHFLDELLAHEHVMAVKAYLENNFAETVGGKAGNNDRRIQHHSHESIRNTSSSVMIPCASANGNVRLRNARNFSRAT